MIHNSESYYDMIKNRATHITTNHEAKPKNLTPDSSNVSFKRFCALRSEYYRKGMDWLSQFVKKRDGIKPQLFACAAGIGKKHFSQMLNGRSEISEVMYTRIAIGIGTFWDEIVHLRLAKYHDPPTSCLSEKSLEEIRQKRINDLKDEYISYFGNDARAILDMLSQKEDLQLLAIHFKEKYLRRFKPKSEDDSTENCK